MKKIFIMFMALVFTATLMAQRIAVVKDGSTQLFRTLQAAIEGADDGSVIYLPGGSFPIANSVRITKKLTIIGIGHKSNNDNVDGITTIDGNLYFSANSSASAVIGCYITGSVQIGTNYSTVEDVLIRYCNLEYIWIRNDSTCRGTVVNQNYIRAASSFGYTNAQITNNIIYSISRVNGGKVANNVISDVYLQSSELVPGRGDIDSYYCVGADCSTITNNVILQKKHGNGYHINSYGFVYGSDNDIYSNMGQAILDGDSITIGSDSWNNVFVNYNGGNISTTSDFHFKDEYKQYEHQVGIYSGTGFSDDQLAPVPHIVAKSIDEQTDAAGKLKVRIRVKAGE